MRKLSAMLLLLMVLMSCNENSKEIVVEIDLDGAVNTIKYSNFVKSLEYINLELPDSLPLKGVKRLYIDKDKVFVADSHQGEILIFDKNTGRALARIDNFGEGPEELKIMAAFCLDTYHDLVCIFDKGDMKIKMYSYEGKYVSSYSSDMFFIDMVKLDENSLTYFYPIYAEGEQYNGIWTRDYLEERVNYIDSLVTPNNRFHYFPMIYNYNGDNAFYYDRYKDQMYIVTADAVKNIYKFKLSHKLPEVVMGMKNLTPDKLDGYSIVHEFVCSENYLLLSTQTFEKSNISKKNLKWFLLDRKNGEKMIANNLENDLDSIVISNNSLYFLDEYTWVRVDDTNDKSITMQIMHLK